MVGFQAHLLKVSKGFDRRPGTALVDLGGCQHPWVPGGPAAQTEECLGTGRPCVSKVVWIKEDKIREDSGSSWMFIQRLSVHCLVLQSPFVTLLTSLDGDGH